MRPALRRAMAERSRTPRAAYLSEADLAVPEVWWDASSLCRLAMERVAHLRQRLPSGPTLDAFDAVYAAAGVALYKMRRER